MRTRWTGCAASSWPSELTWTFLGHAFGNHYDTQLVTYGGGPSFYTEYGKITFWVGDGFFSAAFPSNGRWTSLQKITLNGFWDTYYKKFDFYAYINRTFYPEAPDRTLYDFKGTWNRRPGREYYSVFGGAHDSFLQSDLVQFFAPESITEVKEKILIHNIGAEAQIPFGKHIDFTPYFSQFYYTACQEDCGRICWSYTQQRAPDRPGEIDVSRAAAGEGSDADLPHWRCVPERRL